MLQLLFILIHFNGENTQVLKIAIQAFWAQTGTPVLGKDSSQS